MPLTKPGIHQNLFTEVGSRLESLTCEGLAKTRHASTWPPGNKRIVL